jgi:hypothetical protein
MSSIRIYEVQNEVEDKLNEMSEEELLGAEDVILIMYRYLHRVHFQEQREVDVRALAKTMEELNEACIQLLAYKYHRMDLFQHSESVESTEVEKNNVVSDSD